jgi:hypothetical protein
MFSQSFRKQELINPNLQQPPKQPLVATSPLTGTGSVYVAGSTSHATKEEINMGEYRLPVEDIPKAKKKKL